MDTFARDALPKTQVFRYYDPEPSESQMEFRLIYQGPLPPEGQDGHDLTEKRARAPEKQKIRKYFHPQLRELWKQHPELRRQAESYFTISHGDPNHAYRSNPGVPGSKTWVEHIADRHITCNGNRFVPLVNQEGEFTCSLDILFLRRDNPGGIIRTGGDIDNRIKVLFDGLTMPTQASQLGNIPIEEDENPFYCLLEDDKLVTSLSVTTDRLILPKKSDENEHDVFLVIHVTVVNPSAIFAGDRLV